MKWRWSPRCWLKNSVCDRKLSARHSLPRPKPGLNETGAGAVHWRDPWTVSDPGGLVSAYADLFTRAGGTFVNGDATTLAPAVLPAGRFSRMMARSTPRRPWCRWLWVSDLLQKFDYRFPMLRKRGYHRHFTGGGRLNLPLHDPEFAYAMAPMAKGLRITSGAELMGPERSSQSRQLERAEQAARRLVDLGTAVEAEPWSGVRPCMPDMLPVVGAAPKHKGLWMHFGQWPSRPHPWPHHRPPARRDDERRGDIYRSISVQSGAVLIVLLWLQRKKKLFRPRPGPIRRGPSVRAPTLETFYNNQRHGVWVPAFAGTTRGKTKKGQIIDPALSRIRYPQTLTPPSSGLPWSSLPAPSGGRATRAL